MADEKERILLEREYIVPLRRKFLRTPRYRRAPKAVKILKQFIARHMKVYDKDLSKIKLDRYLNEEMWYRGIQKPPYKIKVKAKKLDSGNVVVELAEIPEKLKWKKLKEEKTWETAEKKTEEEKKEEKKEEKPEEKPEKIEEIEKEKAVVESGLKEAEKKHKELKHEVKLKKEPKHQFRKALAK